jgi:hypothetical protein
MHLYVCVNNVVPYHTTEWILLEFSGPAQFLWSNFYVVVWDHLAASVRLGPKTAVTSKVLLQWFHLAISADWSSISWSSLWPPLIFTTRAAGYLAFLNRVCKVNIVKWRYKNFAHMYMNGKVHGSVCLSMCQSMFDRKLNNFRLNGSCWNFQNQSNSLQVIFMGSEITCPPVYGTASTTASYFKIFAAMISSCCLSWLKQHSLNKLAAATNIYN